MLLIMNGKQEYGDYQTPHDVATRVCEFLKTQKDIRPDIVLDKRIAYLIQANGKEKSLKALEIRDFEDLANMGSAA